jgi:hypothetical protein
MELNNDELISVLRAMRWHIDRLVNTDENVRDEQDLGASKIAHDKLTRELKLRAYIK